MCGIAGAVSFTGTFAPADVVARMTATLAHRGPDAGGNWTSEHGNAAPGAVALGHRRLSIIDLSAEANQPMTDATGRYVLSYNGELYNFRELRSELADYPFRTQSDSEVILAAYGRWGVDCLRRFNGMFALALYDIATDTLLLARDRLGEKPLYYHRTDAHLLFASELRTLLASGHVPRQLDMGQVAVYLNYQTTFAPDTLVAGVCQLPTGHYATLQRSQWHVKPYWHLTQPTERSIPDNPETLRSEVRGLLRNAVSSRMISDRPVGAFLSGGIDSGAVVALMAEASTQPVNTFTLVFDDEEHDESVGAARLARRFYTRHTALRVTPGWLLERLPTLLARQDSPSADGLNTYVVAELTKQSGITVALSGLGGDELFAGYNTFGRYGWLHRLRGLWQLPPAVRRSMAATLPRVLEPSAAGRVADVLQLAQFDRAQVLPLFRQAMPPDRIRALLPALPDWPNPPATYLGRESAALDRLPRHSQVSVAEIMTYTGPLLLRDADQMSMAHALEIRLPFFDPALVDYVLRIPDRLKTKPGRAKALLVDSLRPLLPNDLGQRPKKGFNFPWDNWLRHDLRDFCADRLTHLAQREGFDASAVRAVGERFWQGHPASRWNDVWLLTVLEEWLMNGGF